MEIAFVIKEDDGMAWYEDGKIYINARWLTDDVNDVVKDITSSFIHEYVEHILGLGHEKAVYVEKKLFS